MTTGITNPDSLRKDQYKNSSNLSARAELHQKFSSNSTGWHQWVFDQINFPEKGRILEVGSGPGYLWQQNVENIADQQIYLSDISTGMLEEARAALGAFSGFSYAAHDVCNIPFPESFFDIVIANHMLYHVPDIPLALKEIRRVLKHGCCLYAATNGDTHLHEIKAWKSRFFPGQDGSDWSTSVLGFSIENGKDLLRQEFSNIYLIEYPDKLLVDQIQPIIRYIQSYSQLEGNDPRTVHFHDFLQQQIAENGSIQITKESGVFSAVKR